MGLDENNLLIFNPIVSDHTSLLIVGDCLAAKPFTVTPIKGA